jgi:hypothetical protein
MMNNKRMMSAPRKFTAMLCATLALLLGASVQAEDRPLDAPRAQGLIGERFDGYAVVHDAQASAAIRTLVDNTNSERRKVYEKQAKATNAPVAEVGKVYAAEIVQKAPAGTWLQGADGRWTQK